MSARHWVWISAGLIAWAVLVMVWATGPYDCSAPNQTTGRVSCR